MVPGAGFLLWFVVRAGHRPGMAWGSKSAWRFTLFDDAMISMTYARTLARTGELEWYPGAPRVQGITNPLWTLMMAAIHVAGVDGSQAALLVSLFGVGLVLVTGLAVARLVRTMVGGAPLADVIAGAAGGAVPFLYSSTFWSLRGMEVGLLALLVVLLVTEVGDGKASLFGIAVVGISTRLDFAVLIVAVLLAAWWPADAERRARLVRWLALPAVSTVIVVLVWQRVYYDSWLPNTYHLKVDGYSISDRIGRGLVNLGRAAPLLIAAGLAAISLARRPGGLSLTARAAAACVLATCVYSVWVGGDAWEWSWMLNRYVSVALPAGLGLVAAAIAEFVDDRTARLTPLAIGAVLAAALWSGAASNAIDFGWRPVVAVSLIAALVVAALAGSWRHQPVAAVSAVVLAALMVGGIYPAASWLRHGGTHVRDDQRVSEQGIALAHVTDDGAVIAVVWAGASAYYADRAMVDLLGKSDPVVARAEPRGELLPGHNRWDLDHSIGELDPDVVLGAWGPLDEFDAAVSSRGYTLRCLILSDGSAEQVWISPDVPMRVELVETRQRQLIDTDDGIGCR